MLYIVDEFDDEPIMLINSHIGFDKDDGVGIMGDEFAKSLFYLDTLDKKRIQVYINSEGGSVMDGMDIYYAIAKTKTPVDTYCTGICASIAGVIFQAGRKRVMVNYGKLMYHPVSGADGGKEMKAISDSLVDMICKGRNVEKEKVEATSKKTSWIYSSEALAGGLCDEIENVADLNNKFEIGEAKMIRQFTNKLLDETLNKNSNMKSIAAKLGLKEDATEAEIITAITNKESEISKLKNEMEEEEMEDKMKKDKMKDKKDMEDKLNAMETECKNLKETISKMENKFTASEATASATAAASMVNKYTNRIGNKTETLKLWIDKAVTDLDGTEALLKELPFTNKSKDIQELAKNAGGKVIVNELNNEYKPAEGEDVIDAENPQAYMAKQMARKSIEVRNRVKIG